MMKNTLSVLSLSIFTLISSNAISQTLKKDNGVQRFGKNLSESSQERTPSGHIRCFTSEYEASLRSQDSKRQTTEEFEQWLAPLVQQLKTDRATGKNVQAVYTIPVVVHIVHNGDCLGTGENITDKQAMSQINVLNQDYRRMTGTPGGANSTGLATDIEINFVLAKRDPSGNPTTGIDRVVGALESYNKTQVENLKKTTIWDPTKYLNMWTFRFGGNLATVLGYAQFPTGSTLDGIPPGTTTANTDGVVASFDAFGTIAEDDGTFLMNNSYFLGRTMTHEVGHWLGLRHIWGDGDCSVDDYCADTPLAAAANYDCVVANSCPEPGNDQYQNYMDYSFDTCMDTFTPDQKARMQTVMANSPRRSTLNTSNGGTAPSAGIYFNQGAGKCDVVEGSNCSFIDVNYTVSTIKAPSADAVVTFSVDAASTATNNVDFQIMTPTVTFAAGSTANQTLTVRYFNDGISEPAENVVIGMTVTGGDAAIIAANSKLKVTIIDNDVAPTASSNITILSETYDPPTTVTGIKDLDGDGRNWGVSAPGTLSIPAGFTTNYAASNSWVSGVGGVNPDNIIFTPVAFTLPATGNINLSFGIGTFQEAPYFLEHYSVYLTTINPATFTTATLNAQTAVINNAVLAGAEQKFTINTDITSYAGQTVYLVFRHYNTFDQNLIMLDDIFITASNETTVQTELNNSTKYQATIPAAGNFFTKDATTGSVMLDGTANAFNYGCTSVEVNRSITSAGAPAVNYGSNTANNLKVMAKTFLVTPTTNSANGTVSMKFYFTEAEIAAWEAATGNNRSALVVFKGGATTTSPATIGSFGSGVTLTATFNTGLAGTYYFGIPTSLATKNFNSLSEVSIYPNPTANELNINLFDISSQTNYTIYNSIGQTLRTSKVNSQADLSINTSSYSEGIYFIKIEKDGASKTFKFIKK